jgi:hypothetical protein
MVGTFSSCYSYGQFINKITILRKAGKEVKEIVRLGSQLVAERAGEPEARKVLLMRELGLN